MGDHNPPLAGEDHLRELLGGVVHVRKLLLERPPLPPLEDGVPPQRHYNRLLLIFHWITSLYLL